MVSEAGRVSIEDRVHHQRDLFPRVLPGGQDAVGNPYVLIVHQFPRGNIQTTLHPVTCTE